MPDPIQPPREGKHRFDGAGPRSPGLPDSLSEPPEPGRGDGERLARSFLHEKKQSALAEQGDPSGTQPCEVLNELMDMVMEDGDTREAFTREIRKHMVQEFLEGPFNNWQAYLADAKARFESSEQSEAEDA